MKVLLLNGIIWAWGACFMRSTQVSTLASYCPIPTIAECGPLLKINE